MKALLLIISTPVFILGATEMINRWAIFDKVILTALVIVAPIVASKGIANGQR